MNLLNIARKEDVSKDYLNDDVVLDIKDQKGIYKKRQENQKKQNLYSVSKESNEIDTEIYLDNLDNESRKLDAETSVIKLRIKNAKNNALLGKVNRALDMNSMINENKKKDIPNIQKRAKKFDRASSSLGVISALTTCISVGITQFKSNTDIVIFILQQVFISTAIIYAAIKINDQIKSISDFSDKFYHKKNRRKITVMIGKVFVITIYTSFSIITNIVFWSQFFDKVGTYMFSFLFDFLSIILAVESNIYFNLDFNKKYCDEINEVFDDFENEDDENEEPKEPNYPFDDSNRKNDFEKNGYKSRNNKNLKSKKKSRN